MKVLQFYGSFDESILRQELLNVFPEWRVEIQGSVVEYFGIGYDNNILTLYVPDDANETLIEQVIDAHDPGAKPLPFLDWNSVLKARRDFLDLPNWSTWTIQEATDFVKNDIVNGMTKLELEDWIETNVTNLLTAKNALKLIGGELIDLREICMKLAQMIIYLRDIVVRRR